MKNLSMLYFLILVTITSCNSDEVAPRVISTFPVSGSVDVDTNITEIKVTFSEEMMDGSWSWTGGGESYPDIIASIYHDETKTICTLPVKLKSNTQYYIGINSKSHHNFKDKSGNPAHPFLLQFKTK